MYKDLARGEKDTHKISTSTEEKSLWFQGIINEEHFMIISKLVSLIAKHDRGVLAC